MLFTIKKDKPGTFTTKRQAKNREAKKLGKTLSQTL